MFTRLRNNDKIFIGELIWIQTIPLKGVECFYGAAVWYKVLKSEFEKEEL